MMRYLVSALAGVAALSAAPAVAKPIGFALIDIEGAAADRLNQLGPQDAAAYVATIAASKPATIVANTVLDGSPEDQKASFVTPLPKGAIPKRGAPASVYIVHYALDGLGVAGSLEYRDYTLKSPTTPTPAGPGYQEDRKGIHGTLLEDRAVMFVYGTLTRNRSHGSRYLVAVFQPDGPVKVGELAKADAVLGRGEAK